MYVEALIRVLVRVLIAVLMLCDEPRGALERCTPVMAVAAGQDEHQAESIALRTRMHGPPFSWVGNTLVYHGDVGNL